MNGQGTGILNPQQLTSLASLLHRGSQNASQMLAKSIGTAKNGVDALEKIGQLDPDLLTLDVCMPDINNAEANRQSLKESLLVWNAQSNH